MKYYSHRGYFNPHEGILENSKEAFQRALDANVGIELDVRLTQDLEVVVVHDNSLKRIYNSEETVDSLTYDTLLLKTKSTLEIMKFEDFLQFIDGNVPLIVELKHCFNNKVLCRKVSELLDHYEGSFCVESFNPLIVSWFRKHRPTFKRGQLIMTKDHYEHVILWVLSGTGLTHFLTRPDFYAYHFNVGGTRFSHWYFQRLAKKCEIVLWTIKPNSPQHFNADAQIFEAF